MLMPKKTKYRKIQRGRMKGKATRGNEVSYGDFGLATTQPAWITANQIEAARVAMNRYCKRSGKVWIKIFPDKPTTQKPLGTRMGKGKGAPEYWVAVVKPGKVMFEIADVSEETAREAMRLAANKLPVRCKFVRREGLLSTAREDLDSEDEISISVSTDASEDDLDKAAEEPGSAAVRDLRN